MPVANRDVDELLNIILIYVPTAPARQLVSDLEKSKVADANASFKETMRRLGAALAERTKGEYAYDKRPQQ